MDLNYNFTPRFTEWVVTSGLLETPFVLIDVGVQGGIHPRWQHLGDRLEVHGFDALAEAIAPLAALRRPGHHYYATALGDDDGEATLFVPEIPFAASQVPRGLSPEQARLLVDPGIAKNPRQRQVPMTRLDTLMAAGTIPRADFVKLDCEAAEPSILAGARQLLTAGGVLAVESELSFAPMAGPGQRHSGRSHFSAVYEQLLPHGFRLLDAETQRIAHRSFAERARALGRKRAIAATPGPIAALNGLFVRDLTSSLERIPPDGILKSAIILELYGLNDVAHDLLTTLADRFPAGFPVAPGADRLIYPVPPATPGIAVALRRVTAALRRSFRYRQGRRALARR
jgi:FkbM family methyltransferase